MKKALFFAFLLIAPCAFAAENIERGYISVSTEAYEELSPDVVKISFAIETHAKDAQSAAQTNKETSLKVIEALKEEIAKNESIKTASYILNPEYEYKDGARKIKGYYALNSLQVMLKDTEKAGKIISIALASGANSVSNLEFTLDNTNENCNALIQTAVKEAKERADKTAAAAGSSITGIKSIYTGCSCVTNVRTNFARSGAATAALDNSENTAPIEAGKQKLRATVNANFYTNH